MLRQDQKQLFTPEAADSLLVECADQQPCRRRWPVIASIALHGALLFLILSGGSGGPANVAAGGGVLSAFEVGLASLSSSSGQNTTSQVQDMPAESSPEQNQQPDSAIMPEDAIPLQVESPPKSEQQTTRTQRPESPQRPQQTSAVSEAQRENDIRRDSDGGVANQHVAGGGLVALAAPGAIADGDGRPFGFSLGEVSVQPKVLKSVPVVYPVEARRKGITGQVLVRFHLDENGTVSHLHIKSAEPPEIFDRNTLASIRQWRFEPAKQNKKTVPVWVELPIEFDLR